MNNYNLILVNNTLSFRNQLCLIEENFFKGEIMFLTSNDHIYNYCINNKINCKKIPSIIKVLSNLFCLRTPLTNVGRGSTPSLL